MNITEAGTERDGVAVDLSQPTLIICTTFGILGICGNGLVLFVIARVKGLQDITNFFIANQSLIDFTASLLLLAIFVIPLPPIPVNNPILAKFLCGFWYTQYPFWAMYIATLVNLVIVTLERYVAVIHPLRYRNRQNNAMTFTVCMIPWLVGFLHMAYLVVLADVEDQICYQFQWPNKIAQPAIGIYTFVVFFGLTFSAMFFMYTRMLLLLRQDPLTDGTGTAVHQTHDYRNIAKKNLVLTMLTLCLCYMACWLPNQIIYLYYCLGGDVDFNGVLYYISVMVLFINMWINPFVYVLRYKKFQKGIKQALGLERPAPATDTHVSYTTKD